MSDPRNVLNEGHVDVCPSCFESDKQYRDYEKLRKDSINVRDGNFCLDCDPMYKHRMLCDMKCDHPETKFVMIETIEGPELIGVSNKSSLWNRYKRL